MDAFFTDEFVLPLPEDHRFPMTKYALVRQQLIAAAYPGLTLRVPPAASRGDLERAHDPTYLDRVERGGLTDKEIRALGFPWSPQLVERSRRSVGATIAACRAALRDGVAVNLAGGTHHAAFDRGAAFCVFNDSVVAARALQAAAEVERVVIIDCDVHQGEGTANLLQDDPSITTFSIHGAKNFPFRKAHSDIDVALPDGTDDNGYLAALADGLDRVAACGPSDLAIFIAGADPFIDDRLGRLAVSKAGLRRRDDLVLTYCRDRAWPVAITMGGGYAPRVQDIVDIHCATVVAALRHATEARCDAYVSTKAH